MIKQPLLGQKLAEIRKTKGLTQEELVESCNVSVRTIQRIESGEVTPRYSTVKILLAALDFDLDEWFKMSQESAAQDRQNPLQKMLLTISSTESSKNAISIAWIAGIIYFILMLLETAADVVLIEEGLGPKLLPGYLVIKLLVGISFIMFIRGYVSLGLLFENYLLRVSAYLYGFIVLTIAISDIILAYFFQDDAMINGFYVWTILIMVGAVEIIFGIALLRLQDGMGKLAQLTGLLEIVTGAMFITVILVFIGLITMVPMVILEVVLLYKAHDLIQRDKI